MVYQTRYPLFLRGPVITPCFLNPSGPTGPIYFSLWNTINFRSRWRLKASSRWNLKPTSWRAWDVQQMVHSFIICLEVRPPCTKILVTWKHLLVNLLEKIKKNPIEFLNSLSFKAMLWKISQVGLRVNRVAPETAEGILATSFEKAKRRPLKKTQEVR